MDNEMKIVDLSEKKYNCSKHGFQGGVIGVEVNVKYNTDAPNESYQQGIHTRVCMQCFVDMLNANCCQLTEIEGQA